VAVEEEHTGHLLVGDRIGEDFSEVEKYAAAFVEDLDTWFDFEVFCFAWVNAVDELVSDNICAYLERRNIRDGVWVLSPKRNSGHRACCSLFNTY
jgi:hypothetical protein